MQPNSALAMFMQQTGLAPVQQMQQWGVNNFQPTNSINHTGYTPPEATDKVNQGGILNDPAYNVNVLPTVKGSHPTELPGYRFNMIRSMEPKDLPTVQSLRWNN